MLQYECDTYVGLAELGYDVDPPQTNMVWCAPPRDVPAERYARVAHALAEEDGILVGGAYGGPSGRQARRGSIYLYIYITASSRAPVHVGGVCV